VPSDEYFLFLRSLGWLAALTLATLLPALSSPLGRRHTAWLIAFCALQALTETQTLIFAAPDSEWRLPAALVGAMLLWEFAHRIWHDHEPRRLPAALHLIPFEGLLLLLAVTLPQNSTAWPTWFVPLGLAIAALPALFGFAASLLLWRCLALETNLRRRAALRLAALALGLCTVIAAAPGLPAIGALAPWSVVAGFGAASLALPAVRTRAALVLASGLIVVPLVAPFVTTASVLRAESTTRERFLERAQRAATAFARPLSSPPLDPAALHTALLELRASDPALRDATLWRLDADRLVPLDATAARAATADEKSGATAGRRFFVLSSTGTALATFTAHAPIRLSALNTTGWWLALEYPGELFSAPRESARRAALALLAVAALFCAMGFAVASRQALDHDQRLHLERTESASHAKTEFLAFLSHEMRTPLQTILGRTELLRRETPAATRQADAIETQGVHLLRLVNDLLDLGTIEAGKLKLTPAPFSLRALVASLEETHGPVAATKGLTLTLDLSPTVPDALIADETRLRQILGNLLNNAVKYTTTGTVTLHVSRSQIPNSISESISASFPAPATSPLHLAPHSERLAFAVHDTGPGLPPEKIPQLFTVFTRLDSGATFTREGTGLGLALVRRLCDLMGGAVTAANRPTGGAAFTVHLTFPLADSSLTHASTSDFTSSADAPARRILLAEDNTAAREFLTEALAVLGYSITAVADGQAALVAARTHRFAAALLDINLPLLDGIALARILRTEQPALRLIGCSAEAAAETRAAALAAGMHEFLAKPVSLSALARALAPAAPAITQLAADISLDIFARLATPATLARARATLRAEWPQLHTTTTTALAAADPDALRRLAHYLQSTALILDDAALLELCARLSRSAAPDSTENPRTLLAALDAHLNSCPSPPPVAAPTQPPVDGGRPF
jgi:signal transduction histidine kinase/CheY-like chemotaxis protein